MYDDKNMIVDAMFLLGKIMSENGTGEVFHDESFVEYEVDANIAKSAGVYMGNYDRCFVCFHILSCDIAGFRFYNDDEDSSEEEFWAFDLYIPETYRHIYDIICRELVYQVVDNYIGIEKLIR